MSRYNVIYYSDELYHHGIKGQRWGRRRWQNEDGTLTEEGKERYGTVENFERAQKRKKIIAGVALTAAVVGGGIYLYNKGKRSSAADTSLANEGKKAVNKALEKVGDKKPDTAISLEGKKKVDALINKGNPSNVINVNKSNVNYTNVNRTNVNRTNVNRTNVNRTNLNKSNTSLDSLYSSLDSLNSDMLKNNAKIIADIAKMKR